MATPGLSQLRREGKTLEVQEVDRSGKLQRQWLHSADDQITQVDIANQDFSASHHWYKPLVDAFLPIGFPHSVSADYLPYQIYDSLQAFFSTITSLLSSRALLTTIGVGDSSASTTNALLLTVFKDFVSRVATIFFAYRVGLWIEPEAKFFRFIADVLNDTAFLLELCTPAMQAGWLRVLALSAAEALRALCGVAAGASKAALSSHFARRGNLAELNAKEASQETAVGLIGLLVGSLVVKVVEDQWSVVGLMIALVFAHLYMNYLGVRAVCMETLNRQRAMLLFDGFLRHGKVWSPAEVAQREKLWIKSPVVKNSRGVKVALVELANNYAEATAAIGDPDAQVVDEHQATLIIARRPGELLASIKILLWDGATAESAVRAWIYAMAYAYNMSSPDDAAVDPAEAWKTNIGDDLKVKRATARSWFDGEKFWDQAKAKGWNFDTHALEVTAPVRIKVGIHKKDE